MLHCIMCIFPKENVLKQKKEEQDRRTTSARVDLKIYNQFKIICLANDISALEQLNEILRPWVQKRSKDAAKLVAEY